MPPARLFPVMLRTKDGVRLDAAHLPGRGAPDLAIVLAHGFTGNRREPAVRRIAHALSAFGGVLSLDFRGHGRSGGHSTVGDLEIWDIDAAVRHARVTGYPCVAVVGFSMGGAVAVRHAGLVGGVDAVVSVSAPARWYYRGTPPMRRVHWAIERPLGRLCARVAKRTRIAGAAWETVPIAPWEAAALVAPAPLLIVHGDADVFFPLDHAHQLHDAARDPKELWVEPGYGHAETAATPMLVRRIGGWVRSFADGGPGRPARPT